MRHVIESGLEESPKPDHTAFQRASTHVLLSNSTFLEQAECIARGMGYTVEIDSSCDDLDYKDAAQYLLAKLKSLHGPGRKICLLSGGEVTVQLSANPGTGGRNLQFCLYAASAALPRGTAILSAGTDGIDGNSSAAGAVVDATTRLRGEHMGLRIEDHLRAFDAYNYLAPLGYAIATGPTGNNLRDIRILLWQDPGL
jgi:hydroxypyruvate reductase